MFNKDILPNGIRVVTETIPHVQSVAVGVWVGSGSRDEDDSNRGISHFIEHMLFKGTTNRTAQQIADEFDSIGGHLNAFTEKEYTCYFAKVLAEHTSIAIEVIGDMLLNSIFDCDEIEREKNVVLEEIKRHEDSPDDLVHDIFAQTILGGHPLGRSVLGDRETVGKLTRDDVVSYMGKRYIPENMVIAAAGNLNHREFVGRVADIFGSLSGEKVETNQDAPTFCARSNLTQKTTEQVHFCIGTRGFAHGEKDKYTLAIIDAVLGGGMSSRLFQEIREKRGLAYSIGSYSISYRESGLFAAYGGTSMQSLDEVMGLVKSEFVSIREAGLTDKELERAKNQIRGALVLGQESMSSRMMRLGKTELYLGRIIPLEEIIGSIMSVSMADIIRVANEVFDDSTMSLAAIGPFN
ncbi:MAG: pitrilysin family protein [Armatimonadota bacterium]|nr:pitrilysin family protein [Armatimonadota bacterium]